MLRSFFAVVVGMLVALAIGLLVLFGIVTPVFTEFVSPRLAENSALPAGILLFAVAFALYFGGMAAGYRASSHHRLHGVAVAVVLFLISPVLNLITGREPLPQLETAGRAVLTVAALSLAVVAAYVGASRGASLYSYHESYRRSRRVKGD